MERLRGLSTGPNGKPVLGSFESFMSVKDAILCRRGETYKGTLYLAEHHIIFSWKLSEGSKPPTRQAWITYPMIASCTYRPMPSVSRQPPAIRLRCRDFTFVAFQFPDETQARLVYDNIKALTCHRGTLDKLCAFSYTPSLPAEARCEGWHVYDARREYKRMGIGPKEADRGWRISNINHDYEYSPTYPSLLVVPSSVSDNVLKHGGSYRSKARIPVLTYLHPVNNCSITRSSQPLVGLFKGKRNPQDERLVAAIFSTSKPAATAPSLTSSTAPPPSSTMSAAMTGTEDITLDMSAKDTTDLAFQSQEASEPDLNEPHLKSARSESDIHVAKIYGAQQRNLIIDARPIVNARVNQIGGMGSENMEFYKDATINFLGIDNIHAVRNSLHKVYDAQQHSDYTRLPPDQELLARSKWLKYIKLILRGSDLVARQVGINHSHVLIHCSDGWDRTSQISAISQMCLDPYYRTLEGFIVLVEKDWLSFGHMFRRRGGLLGSEKWFEIENERVGGNQKQENGIAYGPAASNAFGNALLSAKGFFNKKNDSMESLNADGDGGEGSPSQVRASPSKHDKFATKPDEVSPIFHQFLDATWQLLRQHPTRFEFNDRFLRRLLYHLYSCQYGTFLYDCERERVEYKASERTRSVWDYFLARKEQFTNEQYVPDVDDKTVGKERLLFPDTSDVRWWPDLFSRTDEEMNGTPTAPAFSLPQEEESVVTGIESSDVAVGPAANGGSILSSGAERLTASLSGFGLGRGNLNAPISRPHTPSGVRKGEKEENELRVSDAASFAPAPSSLMKESAEQEDEAPVRTPVPSAKANEISYAAFARDSAFRDL